MKTLSLIIVLTSLSILSCGKSDGKKTSPQFQVEEAEGAYLANLVAVNPKVNATVNGVARVSHFGDDFRAKIVLKDAPRVTHKQYMFAGTSCPILSRDDLNGDGYIDAEETLYHSGKILIPLDGDLSGQLRGIEQFPFGDYTYVKSTSYALMLSDLHASDDVFNDDLVKLASPDLTLTGRVIMVMGVAANSDLPSSARSLFGATSQATLPIACGELAYTDQTQPDIEQDQMNQEPAPVPRRPAPTVRAPKPEPVEETPVYRNRMGRISDRVRGWWCRIRGCTITD
jgi:hypothetical protein